MAGEMRQPARNTTTASGSARLHSARASRRSSHRPRQWEQGSSPLPRGRMPPPVAARSPLPATQRDARVRDATKSRRRPLIRGRRRLVSFAKPVREWRTRTFCTCRSRASRPSAWRTQACCSISYSSSLGQPSGSTQTSDKERHEKHASSRFSSWYRECPPSPRPDTRPLRPGPGGAG